jgi:hypothetical protein
VGGSVIIIRLGGEVLGWVGMLRLRVVDVLKRERRAVEEICMDALGVHKDAET